MSESRSESRRYHVTTFGCQMNKADSERMAGILENMGMRWEEDPLAADVVLYNTCTIRDSAEQKVYSYLGKQAKRKRKNPNLTLVVAGCVAQQEGESLLRRVPELDLVMGPQYANQLESLLEQVGQGNQVVATEPVHIMEDITRPRRDSEVTAWVNVIYGCNERCTYCVVPGVRGVEQSRTPEAIRAEMVELGQQGYTEVTLLGQNIDAYGRDLPGITPEGRREIRSLTCFISFMTCLALSAFALPLATRATLLSASESLRRAAQGVRTLSHSLSVRQQRYSQGDGPGLHPREVPAHYRYGAAVCARRLN